MDQSSFRSVAPLLLLLLTVVVVGCATAPPVQEMSDARQAIAAAREAGAEDLAPAGLAQAEELLDGAEAQLEVGTSASYWQAKKAAISAKEVAFEALLTSRDARDAAAGRSR
ncbi:MAG: DUF4398 domain-containing protein [Gammaproteobacteria bacterium]|nr:DUF4398 domain-containing protein [Gammaproteobacteria bacterium]